MKNVIFIVLLVASFLNANNEYNLKYKLFNDGEEIGVLEALCIKNSEGIYKYSTRLDIEFSYMFMKHKYLYVEDAYVEDKDVVSLFVYEKEDDDTKKVKAVRKGQYLVYSNGAKVDLAKIDYLPFNFMPKLEKAKFNQEKFILKTFDTLSGEVYEEKNTILKEENGRFHMETISEDFKEEKVISPDGIVEYMKNEYFEAKLLKK